MPPHDNPPSVAQLDACPTSDQRVAGSTQPGRLHSWRFDHEIFSAVILSLPLIQEGQLSVSDSDELLLMFLPMTSHE